MPPSTLSVLQPVLLPKKKAEEALPADVVPAIADLREKWHRLHDLDRAVAVRDIIRLGVARRRLAREMGFSEGLFRHLLKALKAPPADQELARQHVISTNELVRRAEGRPLVRPAKRPSGIVLPPDLPLLLAVPAFPSRARTRKVSPAAKRLIEAWRNR
jgi:hypothetical protein